MLITIIVAMLVLGYLLIATGHLTGVNKAAIAMFLGTVGWVIYVCWGNDFVMQTHSLEYIGYLKGEEPTSYNVKTFIYTNVFLNYVGRAASIVMFLLATMSIIEILNNNGCFDFISEWVRTRNSKRLLWTLTIASFILSANIDNLTTTVMMLVIMRGIIKSRRQRMLVGAAIVLAATAGGCFTVIGDPIGLVLWGNGAVTATHFSGWLLWPVMVAWIVPTLLISRQLPSRLDTEWTTAPYRGDDTRLNRWQRILMLLLGVGGLWFVPTFHRLTQLSAFLGALCVLSVLWVVNEAFNRKLMQADQMAHRRIPRVLQYGTIQQMLFVMGIMLAMGVMTESGVLGDIADTVFIAFHENVWAIGVLSGILSALVDTFTIAITHVSFYDVSSGVFAPNGIYWLVIAYCTAMGGCLLSVGSVTGLALMKMENMHLGWYFRNLTWKVLIGFILGLVVLYLETLIIP